MPIHNKRFFKNAIHATLIITGTVLTQIGGLVYLGTLLLLKNKRHHKRLKIAGLFVILYGLATFVIVPVLAPLFGREKIKETAQIEAHSFFYKLANRNYVTPQLNVTLQHIGKSFSKENSNLKIVHLDANFPFINGFPLLPHLSHKDGKKIDVALIYENSDGFLINDKPSVSGYGVFENPTATEINQNEICKKAGYFQYDYPKYLTLGTINNDISFSEQGTKNLVSTILKQEKVGKLFLEPHLVSRLALINDKIKYHGCRAVRHDDHIHFQMH